MHPRGETTVLAVLGGQVRHSLSPAMHNAALAALGLDAVFVALPCAATEVAPLMRALARTGGGGSVTAPHKQVAAASLDVPGEAVGATSACNCFWGGPDDALAGDNTDVDGVLAAVRALGGDWDTWCVAGTGGAARAVAEAARRAGARLAVVSRDPARGQRFVEQLDAGGVEAAEPGQAGLLINATPLGRQAGDPLPFAAVPVHARAAVLDLVYAPGETPWVRAARAAGRRAADGREMLLGQGLVAFRHWFPREEPPAEVMRVALAHALG